jgi:two-component system, OmpR family, KDP operon response regulator KdpE
VSLGVLLVEDDRELRATLRQALMVEGYRVLPAASAADARALWRNAGTDRDAGADLVLLDLGLPDGSGTELLREFRERLAVPVIVISARHREDEKVQLLDAGADDYLVKPFSLGELLARMRVALRHRGRTVAAAITQLNAGDLQIDLTRHEVRKAGRHVHLTPTEFDLLARLVRSAGQVVTHRQLLTDVWGPAFIDHTHYLRLYMGQLRAKLEEQPARPRHLRTEPGVGYRFDEGEPSCEPAPAARN